MSDYPARTPLQLGWLLVAFALVAVLTVGGGWLAWRGLSTWQVTALDSEAGPTPMVEDTPSVPGRTRALTRDTMPGVLLPTTVTAP